jgi:hypothetical protein
MVVGRLGLGIRAYILGNMFSRSDLIVSNMAHIAMLAVPVLEKFHHHRKR